MEKSEKETKGEGKAYSPSPPIRIYYILSKGLEFGLYPYSKHPEPIYFILIKNIVSFAREN